MADPESGVRRRRGGNSGRRSKKAADAEAASAASDDDSSSSSASPSSSDDDDDNDSGASAAAAPSSSNKKKSSASSSKTQTQTQSEAAFGQGVVDVQDFKEDAYYGNTRAQQSSAGGVEGLDPRDPDNIVVLRNVHKTYLLGVEGVPALRGVSMGIKAGEFVVIFGTSGGGKTTMLNILGTIDKPTKGELFIGGTRITESTQDHELSDLRLRKIGFVFQTFNLLSSLSALENVEMPLILDGRLNGADRKARAREVLKMVGMAPREGHVPSQLSGGEQQRVTIARAMANRPDLLLLDEPTGDLDTMNTLKVMKLLTALNSDDKVTMAMVTHDVSLKYFAHRVVWMRDGKIQRIEKVSEAKRQERIRELHADYAAMRRKKQRDSHGLKVELRDPTDYATHPKHVPRPVRIVDAEDYIAKRDRAEAGRSSSRRRRTRHARNDDASDDDDDSSSSSDDGSSSSDDV